MNFSLFGLFLACIVLAEAKNMAFFSKDGETESNLDLIHDSPPFDIEGTLSVEQMIEFFKAQGGLAFPSGLDEEFISKMDLNSLLMDKRVNLLFMFPNSRTINDNSEIYFIESDIFCYSHLYNNPVKMELRDLSMEFSGFLESFEAQLEATETEQEETGNGSYNDGYNGYLDLESPETAEAMSQLDELTNAIFSSSTTSPSLLQPIMSQLVNLKNEKSLINAAAGFANADTSTLVKFYSNPREEVALEYPDNLLVTELKGTVISLLNFQKTHENFQPSLKSNRATASMTLAASK